MVGNTLSADIRGAINATNGQIGVILIESKPSEEAKKYIKYVGG